MEKRFTVEDANTLIPRLELLMERAQRTARSLRRALQAAGDDDEESPPRTTGEIRRAHPDLADQVQELEETVAEIEGLGCRFKGLDLGLVDFPAEIDGTHVYLCWQYGEKEIAYWHPTHEGFSGRRVLPSGEEPRLQ